MAKAPPPPSPSGPASTILSEALSPDGPPRRVEQARETFAVSQVLSATTAAFAAERRARAMEYLVTMTTHVPAGTLEEDVEDIRAREALRARELASEGHLLRLWRPPLLPGESRALGLWRAQDEAEMQTILQSLPLAHWMTVEVTPLSAHPNDPGTSPT